LACIAAMMLIAGAIPSAMAGTIQVGLPFSGQCSLRSAIRTANSNAQTGGCIRSGSGEPDIIQLQAGAYVMESGVTPPYIDEDANVEGDYDITSAIVVQGVSPERTAIEAPPLDRLFDVQTDGSLTLQDVTLYGGNVITTAAPDGGAIRKNYDASLSLIRVLIHGGTATRGGAIYADVNFGTTSLSEVTITGAFASSSGGAIALRGGGVANPETATLTNVTLSGNTAASGSAIHLSVAPLLLINSTIAFNHSTGSLGALHYAGAAPAKTVELANSVLTENTRNTGAGADVSCGTGISLALRTHTLISNVQTCTFDTTVATPPGTNARLLPLFDHGGGIPVHSFSSGSAAANAGNSVLCPDSDARGVARASTCDIGAYEVVVDLQINSTADLPDLTPGDGLCRASGNVCTLRAASMEANARGGRWFVALPAGTYALNQPITNVDDLGGDLDFKPNSESTPPLAFTLLGLGTPANTHIVGNGSDRVIEVRGRYAIENSGRYYQRNISFALFNVTVRGGNLSTDNYRVEPDQEPVAGGGINVIGGHTLFHNIVVRDNQLRFIDDPESLFNSARGAGVNIDVSGWDAEYHRYISSSRFDHFAVVDNTGLITPDTYSVSGGGMAVRGTSSDEPGIGGEAMLINGTIAGNQAYAYSGLSASDVHSSFLTIHGNQVMETFNPSAGAAAVSSGAHGSMRNSIIAGNLFAGQPRDCAGTINTLGHVLVGNDVDCVLSGDTSGNQLNVDPLLGPRLVNANGMAFHRASSASPAIDAIAASRCADHGSIGVSSDALGAVRPWIEDPRCDIGAIEGAALADTIFASGFEN
jgi:hypothetical protein